MRLEKLEQHLHQTVQIIYKDKHGWEHTRIGVLDIANRREVVVLAFDGDEDCEIKVKTFDVKEIELAEL